MATSSFPFVPMERPLNGLDCFLLANRFEETVLSLVPTAKRVAFVSPEEDGGYRETGQSPETRKIMARVAATGVPEKGKNGLLVLPLPSNRQHPVVAVISELDEIVAEKATDEWLREIAKIVEQRLKQIKTATLDPITGVYGANFFQQTIIPLDEHEGAHLVLVEALPAARTPRDVFSHVHNVAVLLSRVNRSSFPLFHLGMGVFAFLLQGQERQKLKAYCHTLIAMLKGNRFRRAHCGCSSMHLSRRVDKNGRRRSMMMVEEAWMALQTACRRGAFAFCDYDVLINPEHFPLQPLPRSLIAKLHRRCRSRETYAVLYIKPDGITDENSHGVIDRLLVEEEPLRFGAHFLVIKDRMNSREAREWALATGKRLRSETSGDHTFSAGICSYPALANSVAETVRSAQKALLHASYYGPGSVVVFDALSLNVSGDEYYNEGDWATAIQEYKKGLALAPDDINLLNSLGVTYGLMNRTTEALASFERVLAISPDNFMALYNKGLGKQTIGDHSAGVVAFQRARVIHNRDDSEEAGVMNDLLFQLGVSLFMTESYEDCIETMKDWFERNEKSRLAGSCCRYIGMSMHCLERAAEATRWLQLALVNDEFDAEAMSLLGEIYLKCNEGNDIALRLCEKAVEIDPGSGHYRLRLAKVLAALGRSNEALEQLSLSAQQRKTKQESCLERGRLLFQLGKRIQGKRYLNKLLTGGDVPKNLAVQAAAIIDNDNMKGKEYGLQGTETH